MATQHESTDIPSTGKDEETELRRQAVKNLQARRALAVQAVIYVLVNAMLFWFWARDGYGFPWPLFVLVFWGIGLFWQAWGLFGPGESEDRVRKEMDRLRGAR